MTALRRAECPNCGKSVPVRTNGMLREHYVYRLQADQRPLEPLGRVKVCPGTGTVAR